MISTPGQESIGTTRSLTPVRSGGNHLSPGRVVREVLVILLAALLYFFVRGLMQTQTSLARTHAEALIALEQRLRVFHEPVVQGEILGFDWLVNLANRVYILGHWPVIAGTMFWLVWRHTEQFALYRSALLLSGAIGLVCFALLPMAPPRFMVHHGFVDTVTLHSQAYRVLQPPSLTNEYAAMPSLHVGWNLLMGIAIHRNAATRWAQGFGVLMPLVMWLATIATANHYFLDGVVGSVVALAGLALASKISCSREQTEPAVRYIPSVSGHLSGQDWNRQRVA
jgi:hypothetical protein